jgi:hypothetical protein
MPPRSLRELKKRRKVFYDLCAGHVGTYGREMMRNFFDYWTEPNKSYSKMRFELQATWDLSLRIAAWARKDMKFKSNSNHSNTSNNGEETPIVG